jgi:hypothetical protein
VREADNHIVPMSRNLGALILLDPSGPAWPVMGVLYLFTILSTTPASLSCIGPLFIIWFSYCSRLLIF